MGLDEWVSPDDRVLINLEWEVDDWVNAYLLMFGAEQINKTYWGDGEVRFLQQMKVSLAKGQKDVDVPVIQLIHDALRARGQLLPSD